MTHHDPISIILSFSEDQCLVFWTYYNSPDDQLTLEIWDVEGDKYGDLKGTEPLLSYTFTSDSESYNSMSHNES